MQRLKLKRIKKKAQMPPRRTVNTIGFKLNEHWIDVSVELDNRVFVTDNANGKIYQLLNEID